MLKRILLAGGGTGGHVFPLMAVAESLRQKAAEKNIELETLVLGSGSFLVAATQQSQIRYKPILTGKFRRYFSPLNVVDVFKFAIGFLQCLWHMFWFMPNIVFTKGGAATIAPALVARLYFIPLFIHESDATPGLANRVLAKIADKIFTSFPITQKYLNQTKIVQVGNPVRKELFGRSKEDGLKNFGLSNSLPVALIVPGSQGSRRVNQIVLESLVQLVKKFQIIHQSGQNLYNAVKSEIDQLTKEGENEYGTLIKERYRLQPFFDSGQMALAYAAADVIISRAGAANIFEIAQLGKPVILIPLSTEASRGEQLANALELAKHGASVIEEVNLTPHILINQMEFLLRPEHYQAIGDKLKTFATPGAANAIADAILTTDI